MLILYTWCVEQSRYDRAGSLHVSARDYAYTRPLARASLTRLRGSGSSDSPGKYSLTTMRQLGRALRAPSVPARARLASTKPATASWLASTFPAAGPVVPIPF
eukprot:8108777-Pyramimonas_sp.AAC.2